MAKVLIGCDHRGVDVLNKIVSWCKVNGHTPVNMGPDSTASVDYPDYAFPVVEKTVHSRGRNTGVLICGWGNGMAIAANKVRGARAALCTSRVQAQYARSHNNANILVLSAEATGWGMIEEILDAFINGNFDGGRHRRRVEKISSFERGDHKKKGRYRRG